MIYEVVNDSDGGVKCYGGALLEADDDELEERAGRFGIDRDKK